MEKDGEIKFDIAEELFMYRPTSQQDTISVAQVDNISFTGIDESEEACYRDREKCLGRRRNLCHDKERFY